MNTDNPIIRRFSLPLFIVLALSTSACGAAPDDTTATEDLPVSTASSSDSVAADYLADQTDAGQDREDPLGHIVRRPVAPVQRAPVVPPTRPFGSPRPQRIE